MRTAPSRLVALALLAGAAAALPSCGSDDPVGTQTSDSTETRGEVEVLLTEPFCDVCTAADKEVLVARSPIVARVIALLDGAQRSVDIAQFTWSAKPIEAAVLRAHERGVQVRVALDAAQDKDGSVGRRLAAAGVPVRFVRGAGGRSHDGIMHAKFMLVDGETLLSGSNNWSSTGTSINEENTLVLDLAASDPRIERHACQFEAIWSADLLAPGACSGGSVAFSPSSAPQRMIRDAIRAAETSIDVLMHHLTMTDLVKELAKAAERGVRVRVIVNAQDRAEHGGAAWDRLFAAGGRIRFKQVNEEQFQLMHHKLAIIDDRVLINGSGNWSGSAFFKNFETWGRYEDPRILQPFRGLYYRLWAWSLSAASLDGGVPAHEQHAAETQIYFGNLHAHFTARDGEKLLDDGEPHRLDDAGATVPVDVPPGVGDAAAQAYEYARDRGGLDFMALTPHCQDQRPEDPASEPNMSATGFEEVVAAAGAVTEASAGTFVALAGAEWSTNGTGNHLGVFGTRRVVDVERGAFADLYERDLLDRAFEGDRPLVMLAHPRTFPMDAEQRNGNWDQIFGLNLLELPKAGERKQKFNDYGLDDFPPLSGVRGSWIEGEALPDPAIVAETQRNVAAASAPYARLIEVTLNRGTELGSETPRNPSLTEEPDGTVVRRTKVHTDWDYYLLQGFRLAPAATHDNHMANWGTGHTSRTGLLAEGLDEARLLGAIEQRAVFASEDQDLAVRLYAERREPMGGRLATRGESVSAQLLLTDPDYAGAFDVRVFRGRVGGPAVEEAVAVVASEGAWATFEVPLPEAGEHFFYVEVLEVDADRMAWSAPIWVERLP